MVISWEIIIYILVALVSIVAVRIGFKFDINEWLKSRREIQNVKYQNICPHVRIEKDGADFFIQDLMVSPPGTINWQCQQCGLISVMGTPKSEVEYWKNHPVELKKRQEQLHKHAKKMGVVP